MRLQFLFVYQIRRVDDGLEHEKEFEKTLRRPALIVIAAELIEHFRHELKNSRLVHMRKRRSLTAVLEIVHEVFIFLCACVDQIAADLGKPAATVFFKHFKYGIDGE